MKIETKQFDTGNGTIAVQLETHDAQAAVRDHLAAALVEAGHDTTFLLNGAMEEARVELAEDGTVTVEPIAEVLGRMKGSEAHWWRFPAGDNPVPESVWPTRQQPQAKPEAQSAPTDDHTRRALASFGWQPLDGLVGEDRLAQARLNETAIAKLREATNADIDTRARMVGEVPSDPIERLAVSRQVDEINAGVTHDRAPDPTLDHAPHQHDSIGKLAAARRAQT